MAGRGRGVSVLVIAGSAVLLVLGLTVVVATPVAAVPVPAAGDLGGSSGSVSPAGRARIAAAAAAAPHARPSAVAADGEIASLRTAFSDTLVKRRSRVAHISATPINYRDSSGRWQPIDDALATTATAIGYAARNTAGPYGVQFPKDLADAPVLVRLGVTTNAPSLAMRLAGATGAPAVASNTATYAKALPGVDVIYRATPSGVKESLRLASRAAPSTFTELLAVPAGVTLSASASGAFTVVSSGGARLASLPAATVVDAAGRAGPVTTTLIPASNAGGFALHVAVSSAWLRTAAFPVTVDPTVTVPIESSTYIEGGADADSNFGSSPVEDAGYDPVTGAAAHALLFFDVLDALPWDATVESATLGLYVTSLTGGGAATVQAYAATTAWTSGGATWNSADGTHPWSAPGGDYSGDSGAPFGTATATTIGKYVYLFPTKAVADWLTGVLPQDGFLIKTPSDSGGPLVGFGSDSAPDGQGPFLDVSYQWPSGIESDQTYARYRLDDHLGLSVNLGANDAQLSATDLDIAGVGQPLTVTRTYDEQGSDGETGDLGSGWSFDPGPDTSLGFFPDTTVYYDPSGGAHVFYPDGTGGWVTPPATDATLTRAGSTWTLALHHSGLVDTFNSYGQLVSRADRNGNTITVHYQTAGSDKISTITDTEGRTLSVGYVDAQISTVTDWAGRVTTYGYDPSETYLTSVTDSAGGVTTYAYSQPYGYLTSVTTPAGRTVDIDASSTTALTVTQVSDPAHGTGPTTSLVFTSAADPGGTKTDTVTDPDGHQSTYTISATRDEVIAVTDANGRSRATSYTPNGNVASLTDALTGPNTLTLAYDPNDNLTEITAPDTGAGGAGWTNTFGYTDPAHPYQPTSQVDGQGNTTAYSYDTPGNPNSVQSGPATLTAHYQGDPGISCGAKAGQLCATTDPDGHSTSYSYFPDGDLQTVTPPTPLGATSYTYDSLSRVATMTDGRGNTTRYSYDGLDRLTQVLTGGATTCTLSAGTCLQLSYDGDGKLLTRTDAAGSTGWAYDALGRVTTKTLPGGTTSSVTYDPEGNVLTYTDVGGTIGYGYDPANNLTSMTEPGGSCTSPVSRCTTFRYNGDNQRTGIDYPSGETITIGYDSNQRQTSVAAYRPGAGSPFLSRTYTYATSAGADSQLRQSVTDQAGATTSYGYDTLNRLVAATATSGPSYSYAYDPAGNLTGGSLGSHTYNPANQISDTGYTYDTTGNLTATATAMTAAYNASNQTTSITPPGGNPIGFSYAGTTQNELLTAGTTTYTNTLLGVTAQTDSTGSVYFTRDPSGNLISLRQGGPGSYTSSYYTLDAQESVLALTDATGLTDTATYSYDPYGNTTSTSGTLATVNPYRYDSGLYNTATGQYHYGARYYNPAVGRWTQPDTQQHPGDLTQENPYTYTGDNPTNLVDPTGRSFFSAVGDTFGAIGSAIGSAGLFEAGSGILEAAGDIGGAIGLGLAGIGATAILGSAALVGAAVYFGYRAATD